MEYAYLFRFTAQDRVMAAPLISSSTTRLTALGDALTETKPPANFEPPNITKIQQQIVSFVNEGEIPSTSIFRSKQPPKRDFLQSAKDGREHTIKDFLERPINLRNFEWKIADAQFKALQVFNFPDDFLQLSMYREKFDGFFGIRSDIKFRLQVNAQPFQLGRLMLVWVPYQNYLGSYGALYDEDSEASMVSRSGCPRVDLDLSLATEIDMLIPYVSPHSHFNFTTGEGTYGKLYVIVYSPLGDVAGNGHVDCTAWINFVSPDLGFPTGAALVDKALIPSTDIPERITAQVGNEEVKTEQYRSIAQDVGKLSSMLKPLNDIPLLSTLSQPTTWALDNISGFLKMCGYSKLQSTNVPAFLKQTPTHFMANFDGVDMSHCLGFASDNATELMPEMVGNDVDEMSLKHIVSTPCYYTHFPWKATDSANKLLWTQTVNPLNFVCNETNSANTFVPTHLAYASAICRYWRGSIDITLKFVKTKFHSGRVRIYFQPGTTWAAGNLRKDYNPSMIVDLRTQTDVVFRVPYVATHPWISVGQSGSSAQALFSTTGIVAIEVLNELVATTTVKADIDVLVEVSAGPDYELACPTNGVFRPFITGGSIDPTTTTTTTTTTQAPGSRKARSIYERITAQMGDEAPAQEQEQAVINKDQIGDDPLRMAWWNNLSTIGEKLLSVRQLIKRSNIIATTTDSSTDYSITISPFTLTYGDNDTAIDNTTNMTYLDYFAHIYAFYRGGVNIKILPKDSKLLFVSYRCNDLIDQTHPDSIVTLNSTAPERFMRTVQPVYTNLEGAVDLHVPYYSMFHMCPVTNLKQTLTNQALGIRPNGLFAVSGLRQGTTIFRSATDSFQFGYLIGPPRCTIPPYQT